MFKGTVIYESYQREGTLLKKSNHYKPLENRIFVSTSCVAGDRHVDAVLARLDGLSIRNVELSGPHPHIPHTKLVSELTKYRNSGMSFIIHNYFPRPESDFVLNIASFDAKVIENSYNLVNSALDLSQEIEALFYSCHAGYLADATIKENGYFQFNSTSMQSREVCIAQAACTINNILENRTDNLPSEGMLLENLFPAGSNETFSLACTPQEIKDLFDALGNPIPGLLLDLSHLELTCLLYGLSPDDALREIIDTMGNRIQCVHLSGNDGRTDSHIPLRPEAWQLRAARCLLKALPETAGDVVFTIECREMDDNTLLSQINQLIDSLERQL